MPRLLCDFWLPGKPRGKARQTFTVRARVKDRPSRMYSLDEVYPVPRPPSTKQYEEELRWRMVTQMKQQGAKVTEQPVEMRFCAFYPPVKSDTIAVSRAKVQGRVPRLMKPDVDNIGKIILDAANTFVFLDDEQVVRTQGAKVFGPHEGIRAKFYTITPEELADWHKAEFEWAEEEFTLEG